VTGAGGWRGTGVGASGGSGGAPGVVVVAGGVVVGAGAGGRAVSSEPDLPGVVPVPPRPPAAAPPVPAAPPAPVVPLPAGALTADETAGVTGA
jgi:hypothetical protein